MTGKPSLITRIFRGPRAMYRAGLQHPVWSVFFACVGTLGLFAAEDAYHQFKPWKADDADTIGQLQAAQKQRFDGLEQRLAELRDALPAEGRDAFNNLKESLAGLERDSAGVIQQLAVAQRENESMRLALAQASARVQGGYDFMVSEQGSFRIDDVTSLGVSRVNSRGVEVSLSHPTDAARGQFLRPGQALPFVAADGRACNVAVHTVADGEAGAASFVVACVGERPVSA